MPSVIPGATSFELHINPANNPASVKYALVDLQAGAFLSTNMIFEGADPLWRTIAEWGTIVVTGAIPLTEHEVAVIARNPNGSQTDYSPSPVFMTLDSDSEPRLPNPVALFGMPVASGTDSLFAESVQATDKTQPVKYNFRLTGEGSDIYSGWHVESTWNKSGLVPGGRYSITVQACDSAYPVANSTAPSDSATVYINPAQPGVPAASDITQTSLKLTIDRAANSLETFFAIQESVTGRYVNASGALASYVPVWRTLAQWGTPVNVTGMQAGTTRFFRVIGRSGDEVISIFSGEREVTMLPEIAVATPAPPTQDGLAPRSIRLALSPGTYAATITFLIRCSGGATGYIQADGSVGATQTWRTLADWASPVLVHTLAPNTTYRFDIMAQDAGELSDWSTQTSVLTNIEGDSNGDNKVNILDLILVRNTLNQSVYSGLNYRCDANDDGKINILDLILIRNNLNHMR